MDEARTAQMGRVHGVLGLGAKRRAAIRGCFDTTYTSSPMGANTKKNVLIEQSPNLVPVGAV